MLAENCTSTLELPYISRKDLMGYDQQFTYGSLIMVGSSWCSETTSNLGEGNQQGER